MVIEIFCYLDCEGSYTDAYICKKYPNFTLQSLFKIILDMKAIGKCSPCSWKKQSTETKLQMTQMLDLAVKLLKEDILNIFKVLKDKYVKRMERQWLR